MGCYSHTRISHSRILCSSHVSVCAHHGIRCSGAACHTLRYTALRFRSLTYLVYLVLIRTFTTVVLVLVYYSMLCVLNLFDLNYGTHTTYYVQEIFYFEAH